MEPDLTAPAVDRIMRGLLLEYQTEPVDLLSIGDAEGEYRYVCSRRQSYVRTVIELVRALEGRSPSSVSVLEIGTFLGPVSIALAKLGFKVTATDIEEFVSCQNLRRKMDRYGIELVASNLRDHELPFGDEVFDVVVMCHVLEHLNFNPLPAIKEINRVTKLDGLLYLAVPNIARMANRVKMIRGESIHNPIQDFFAQLAPDRNMIAGLHWREYTADEVREMTEAMGYEIASQRYCSDDASQGKRRGIRRIAKDMIRRLFGWRPMQSIVSRCMFDPWHDPSLAGTQITCARKRERCTRRFYFTDATHPGMQRRT